MSNRRWRSGWVAALLALLLLAGLGGPARAQSAPGAVFDGRYLRFEVPPEWQAEELLDGSVALYVPPPGETPLSGTHAFLVWYRLGGEYTPEERLAQALGGLVGRDLRRDGAPLLVALGGQEFAGQATGGQGRYGAYQAFVAFSTGWGLFVYAPEGEWGTAAPALNRVLRSVQFGEEDDDG